MDIPPHRLFVVYYKTVQGEWRPATPTPYEENAHKLAQIYGHAKVVQYEMDCVVENYVPRVKKVRKIRKVVVD